MPVLYVNPLEVVDWPDEGPDPEPSVDVDVGELPDDLVVDEEPVETEVSAEAHSVRYCTVTPSPLAVIPVVRVPLPNPDQDWFDLVSVALYARSNQTSDR